MINQYFIGDREKRRECDRVIKSYYLEIIDLITTLCEII